MKVNELKHIITTQQNAKKGSIGGQRVLVSIYSGWTDGLQLPSRSLAAAADQQSSGAAQPGTQTPDASGENLTQPRIMRASGDHNPDGEKRKMGKRTNLFEL